jgi:AcrR family transcriptional regulator
MPPEQRRQSMVDAALAVASRQGFSATTARDVAAELGCSSGLIHHYFRSMDELLAAAFDQAAADDLRRTVEAVERAGSPVDQVVAYLAAYGRVDDDGAFQLWLDAWADAARRPALRVTSQRLNVAWQSLLAEVIVLGVTEGRFRCADPHAAASRSRRWRTATSSTGMPSCRGPRSPRNANWAFGSANWRAGSPRMRSPLVSLASLVHRLEP